MLCIVSFIVVNTVIIIINIISTIHNNETVLVFCWQYDYNDDNVDNYTYYIWVSFIYSKRFSWQHWAYIDCSGFMRLYNGEVFPWDAAAKRRPNSKRQNKSFIKWTGHASHSTDRS